MKKTVLLLIIFLGTLIFLPAVAVAEEIDQDREILPVEPGFYGYPLKILRIFDPEHPYPEERGLIVTEVDVESPVGLAGMEPESVITHINGASVNYMPEIEELLNEKVGETLKFEGYELRPSYLKRRREDPFFDFRGRRPYRKFNFEVEYPVRYEAEPDPVIVHPDGELYHEKNFAHSPDTATGRVIKSAEQAREEGYRPCPFCFPGEEVDDDVTGIVDDELPGGSGVTEELQDEYGLIRNLPDKLIEMKELIFPQRLRTEIDPEIFFLDTDRFYGLGSAGGEIIISRGLWDYLEFEPQRRYMLATLLAHMDLQHRPGVPGEEYLFDLIRRGFAQLTGRVSGIDLDHLEDLEQRLPAYLRVTYRGIVERGYDNEEEKRALFLGLIYLHRAGIEDKGYSQYLDYKEEIIRHPHPRRMAFQLQRPKPRQIREKLENWLDVIPDHFESGSKESPPPW